MELTIMSYNIERGFHNKEHQLEEHRLHAAQRLVQRIKPDVLALTEASYGGSNSQGIHMNYASLFDFQYGKFGSYPFFGLNRSDEGGNCLLSRFPMQAKTILLGYKSAVRASIPLEEKVLTVDVVHPSPTVSDDEKIAALFPLLYQRPEPYIITGDFNTVHPEEKYDWEQLRLDIASYNPKKVELIIDNWKKAKLVSWILQSGLKDAFPLEARKSTVPTNYPYGTFRSGVRMDFIFISPDITVEDAYVIKTADAEIASDHYPVVGRFKVE